jgi:hypothetical protein
MSILLKDEEFEELDIFIEPKNVNFGYEKHITKVQAKNVLEWLRENNRSEGRGHSKSSALVISAFKWAELQKEIEG